MSQETKMVKSFSTKDILAMAFGTMIGWGWIMLSGKWAADAGMMGAIGAYLVGAVLCIFIGLAYPYRSEIRMKITSCGTRLSPLSF